jgi:uncharacterized glyoxalase superfamily protein PhnB
MGPVSFDEEAPQPHERDALTALGAAQDPWTRSVPSPDDPNGTELLLAPMNAAAAAPKAHRRAAGVPAISCATDDCRRTYQEMKANGAVFVSEPKQMEYGGTNAVFKDGCGNFLNLHQN